MPAIEGASSTGSRGPGPARQLAVQVLAGLAACDSLRVEWNRLVESNAGGIRGLDATVTYDWCRALSRSHLEDGERQPVIVLRDHDEVVGVMPCFVRSTSRRGIKIREIAPLTQLYSVRAGFVVQRNNPDYVRHVIQALQTHVPAWDVFMFNVVEAGDSERALQQACAALSVTARRIHVHCSPYIELPPSVEEHLARLDKSFSGDVKRRARKLRSEGAVQMRVFRTAREVEELTEIMMSIEKQSCKEDQGTSITTQATQQRFYQEMTGAAAQAGWLRAFVLYFDGTPIAYTYGMLFGGVFQNHKTSYVHALRSKGPGNVLRLAELEDLCSEGVRLYDFMGACESYKMRWGSQRYAVATYALYNATWRGRLEQLRARLASRRNESATGGATTEDEGGA